MVEDLPAAVAAFVDFIHSLVKHFLIPLFRSRESDC